MADSIKDSTYRSQLQIVHDYLLENTATASMLVKDTGIPHKNICRYKRKLEAEGKLWEVIKIQCPVTQHWAWALTTNPDKIRITYIQLKLFENEN